MGEGRHTDTLWLCVVIPDAGTGTWESIISQVTALRSSHILWFVFFLRCKLYNLGEEVPHHCCLCVCVCVPSSLNHLSSCLTVITQCPGWGPIYCTHTHCLWLSIVPNDHHLLLYLWNTHADCEKLLSPWSSLSICWLDVTSALARVVTEHNTRKTKCHCPCLCIFYGCAWTTMEGAIISILFYKPDAIKQLVSPSKANVPFLTYSLQSPPRMQRVVNPV